LSRRNTQPPPAGLDFARYACTERELAELIAANTSGVERVRNRLTVANDY